ncbi:MAG: PDZ domain-containing protein [Candidatus Obscuribacterales bacterium]|nr:PDZ domain-containing protein [Candidatus Obscuribacterales bacterium]
MKRLAKFLACFSFAFTVLGTAAFAQVDRPKSMLAGPVTEVRATEITSKAPILVDYEALLQRHDQLAQGPIFQPPTHPNSAQAPAPAAPAKFDGRALYKDAFEQIRDLHIMLADPVEREAWIKEWEKKFDKGTELDTEEGADKAVAQMLASFKQRYDYSFDKDATSAEKQQVDATLVGIGATMKLSKLKEIVKAFPKDIKPEDAQKAVAISKENALMVDEPIEGGPADKAGVKPGDIIRKVNGTDLDGKSMKDAIGLIKGAENTEVELTIERTDDMGKTSEVTVKITRAKVTVPVVTYKDLGDGISYVRLRDFMSKNAMTEMRDAFTKAAKGKALVIDLRGNPGGSLTAVLTITGMVLEEGPVLTTKSRNGDAVVESEIFLHKDFVLRMEPNDQDPKKKDISIAPRTKLIIPADMPIIVLVDEGSASASEILSGILQHCRRAIVIGKTTVGKGVGQTVVQLKYGRSLHITSFEFIPGRTPNNWIGVVPNIEVERGEDPKVDQQLERAKSSLKRKIERAEKRKLQREELEKKTKSDFEKTLEEREKK